jgi:hypothetical protein
MNIRPARASAIISSADEMASEYSVLCPVIEVLRRNGNGMAVMPMGWQMT